MDSKLNLDSFINNITKKVANKFVMLSKVIQTINKDVALLIYKQMILPYMDYMDFLIDGAAKSKSCKLQKLQNKALRLIRMTKEPGLPMLGTNMLHSEYAVQS